MKEFVHKDKDRIHGVLSCFDRLLFRGHDWLSRALNARHSLPLGSITPWAGSKTCPRRSV